MSTGVARWAELAAEVIRSAASAPVAGDAAAVCALLVLDPLHHRDVVAVVGAILAAGQQHPDAEVTANTWRAHVPGWVAPPVIGATVKRLVAHGILRPTGRWVPAEHTTTGRNGGKPQPVYTLDLSDVQEPGAA